MVLTIGSAPSSMISRAGTAARNSRSALRASRRSSGDAPATTTTRRVPGCRWSASSSVVRIWVRVTSPMIPGGSGSSVPRVTPAMIGVPGKRLARLRTRRSRAGSPMEMIRSGFRSAYFLRRYSLCAWRSLAEGNREVSSDSLKTSNGSSAPAARAVRRLSSKRRLPGSSRRSLWRTTIRVAALFSGAPGRGAAGSAPGEANASAASARALAPTARALFLATEDNLPNGAVAGHRVLLGPELSERHGRGRQIDELARHGTLDGPRDVRSAGDGDVARQIGPALGQRHRDRHGRAALSGVTGPRAGDVGGRSAHRGLLLFSSGRAADCDNAEQREKPERRCPDHGVLLGRCQWSISAPRAYPDATNP